MHETLPTGLELARRFDAAGRPSGVWRRVAGHDFPLLTLTSRDAAGQVREAVFGNGVTLARALDMSGRLQDQLTDDTTTLARGGPGGGGFIDGVTVLPESRTVPLPWLMLPIALALLIRLGLMASGRRATDAPLILIALTDGVLIAALLSPRAVEALVIGYDYDGRGNIETRTFDADTQTFTHDALDRLRSEAGAASTQAFGLDGNGNRLSDASGSYGIAAATNRLATAPYYTPDIDAAGYTRAYRDPQTGEALMAFEWNAAGDLAEVEAGGKLIATYTYDHRHLRVTKTAAGESTVYHFDDTGQLIAETRSSGEPLRSYVWLDGAPVAVIEHAALTGATERTLYLETDLLMTPRAASDDQGRTVWTWKGDAFGATVPEEDPDGDGTPTTLNLRFPGQYFDTETGLHYNWHRYYEPWTGRYLSSDPIGLEGGVNPYTYVDGAPLDGLDVPGLARGGPRRGGSPYPRGSFGNPYGDPVLRNDPSLLRPHRHHSDPIFMGGRPSQGTTAMPRWQHELLHRMLNDFLREQTNPRGDHMRPQRGNRGDEIRENFTRDQRLDALRRFYEEHRQQFPDAARDFFREHPEFGYCD